MMENPLATIRVAKHQNGLRWTHEALKRSLERDIPAEDVYVALNSEKAQLIGNDPSPSCLILGWDAKGRAIHAIVAYARLLLITVYEPKMPWWSNPWERASTNGK
ncbi:MAG: DUF4258 domain-containing protein [Chloroflexi bacterium]|nr:DUF4258 domain-containing protein [Chloroflexota bacterium]